MKNTFAISALLLLACRTYAESPSKGAKSVFVDSTTGVVIDGAAAPARRTSERTKRTVRPRVQKQSAETVPAPVREVSGLMYYVELVSANGETSRVTTDRVFRSGERILLHVMSSIEGDIAIYQRTPSGQAMRLFPDDRIGSGNARITKGADTILPSPNAWFRFDEQQGTEELTVVLTPRNPSVTTGLQAHVVAEPTRYEEISSSVGSKGLVVETESSGATQATYVVRTAADGKPPEPIVVAIRLEHR